MFVKERVIYLFINRFQLLRNVRLMRVERTKTIIHRLQVSKDALLIVHHLRQVLLHAIDFGGRLQIFRQLHLTYKLASLFDDGRQLLDVLLKRCELFNQRYDFVLTLLSGVRISKKRVASAQYAFDLFAFGLELFVELLKGDFLFNGIPYNCSHLKFIASILSLACSNDALL